MKTLNSLAALAVLIATASVAGATDIWVQPGNTQIPGIYSYNVNTPYYGNGLTGQGRKYDGTLEGKTVEYVRGWANDYNLLALDIKLSGDTAPKRLGGNGGDDGNLNYNVANDTSGGKVGMQEFTFQPGERITWCAVYNAYYDGIGGFEFGTDRGRTFSIVAYYSQTAQYGNYYKRVLPDVGSGLPSGFAVKSDSSITQLSPHFYQAFTNAVKTVTYVQNDLDKNGTIEGITIDGTTLSNGTNSDAPLTWSKTESEQFTSSWSVTAGLEVSTEVTVKAGIPGVADVEGKLGFKVSVSGTYGNQYTHTGSVSLTGTVTAKPGETVVFKAIAKRGTCKAIPYSGTMSITFPSNGTTLTYPISGTYNGVSYTDTAITATIAPKPPAKK